MAQHPEIYRYLVNILAGRLRETNEAVAAANFLTVEARLTRALLDLAQHFRGHSEAEQIVISHKMTQNDLAAMAGVARENVSRVLTDWEERKIVVRSSGYYCLYDVTALKRKGSA
jgi:CRP/FNR family transcriptional regulator, cyclic AMP receptor protein